jgi:Zn-dependent oligopeptidase
MDQNHICFKRRKKSDTEETVFQFLEENNRLDSVNNMIKDLNDLKFDNQNKDILLEILKKMNILENRFDNINKLYNKIDIMEKNIDKILVEKDYVIDGLKDEINSLRNDIKETKYNNENKLYDYFS